MDVLLLASPLVIFVLALLAMLAPEQTLRAFRSQVGAVRRLAPPSEVADKMVQRSAAATGAWEQGVQNPSKSPTEQMKKSGKKWVNGVQNAISKNLWDKAVAKLTDAEIFAAAAAAGGSKWAAGISTRADKIRRAFEVLQPKLEAHLSKIDSMPTDTPEQREAKMIANLRGMREIGLS